MRCLIPPRDYRVNERIRVPEVRTVDEDGEQLGVLSIQDAMKLAEEKGMDLVEVAPQAVPPVCRIMDYGKFRYETTRKERDARKARKTKATQELREVRMKTRIGQHDLSAKTRMVKRLLDQGAKVKVSVMFRGREIDHPELGMGLLRNVAQELVDDALLERPPTFEGRFLAMTLAPNPQKEKAENAEAPIDEEEPEKELEVAEA
ncbi:MAG: translation initiation factor IF-3 [Chloroflexi bacterium]|nr:translation initiation factor IF-3 [Chloroflexota bacterium]MDA1227951.1 translation initiation factor IF-3 [Chloroflexota bacterium]